jgi:hypothetical protein
MTTILTETVDFYMLWTKTGWAPRRAHATEIEALDEARRLAVEFPGKKFIVLHATSKISTAAEPELAVVP